MSKRLERLHSSVLHLSALMEVHNLEPSVLTPCTQCLHCVWLFPPDEASDSHRFKLMSASFTGTLFSAAPPLFLKVPSAMTEVHAPCCAAFR